MKRLGVVMLLPYLIYGQGFELDKVDGELRLGAVQIKDSDNKKSSTLSLGGKVSLESKPIYGLSGVATLYTTNAIFGKDSEPMFLGSNSQSYSIVGEAYIRANIANTEIKAGRQIFDTPFIDSDDIGMIPNSVEGYSLVNKSFDDTTIVLGAIKSWSGVDAPIPEKFTKMQNSGDFVMMAGLIYEGIADTTLQAWQYKLKDNDWNYLEATYEKDNLSLGWQYSNQGDGNSIYGLDGTLTIDNLSLHSAYNKVSGVVINGFGGGPFFTSSEDHTVHETLDNEAVLMGAEYSIDDLTLSLTHVDFTKIEDETDYILSYKFNKKLSMDLIYSHMHNDGKMTRFFINHSF